MWLIILLLVSVLLIVVSTSRYRFHPFLALMIGILMAFTLPRKLERDMLSSTGWVGKALQNAAIIILITGAGGAFGMVSLGFETDIAKALVVPSIRAGSLVVSHANDSMFWIFTQMTGMKVRTG